MDRKKVLNHEQAAFYDELLDLHKGLSTGFKIEFNRSLPFADELIDRWEKAKSLGFKDGTSIYDSVLVLGDVSVGEQTWIGPFCILDGTGNLTIGNNCTISSGVHIYTHDNIKKTLSGGKFPIEYGEVNIGDNTYLGPQSIITKGTKIGNQCVIASNSFVNKDVEDNTIVAGNPAKEIGKIVINEEGINMIYTK